MKVISIADLHLRSTVPDCIDANPTEWMNIQRQAIDKVYHYCVDNKVDALLVGGDIFHSENTASFECIILFQNLAISLANMGIKVWIMAGNHDLPQHSSSNVYRAAIGVIFNSKYVSDMSKCPYCAGSNFDEETSTTAPIIFKHTLTIPKDKIPPFVECETPESLLKKYPKANIIFTGDYHRSFSFIENNRCVLNSGCLTKQASDFEDYETGCWLVEFNQLDELIGFEWCPINIEQKFYKNDIKKEIDETINNFTTSIKKESITLDFINSVKNELPNHEKEIQNKVNSWIESID